MKLLRRLVLFILCIFAVGVAQIVAGLAIYKIAGSLGSDILELLARIIFPLPLYGAYGYIFLPFLAFLWCRFLAGKAVHSESPRKI
jgi:hypothetical protein